MLLNEMMGNFVRAMKTLNVKYKLHVCKDWEVAGHLGGPVSKAFAFS